MNLQEETRILFELSTIVYHDDDDEDDDDDDDDDDENDDEDEDEDVCSNHLPKTLCTTYFWSTTLALKHPWLTDCLTCLFVNKTLRRGGYSFPLVCLGFSTNQVRNFNG